MDDDRTKKPASKSAKDLSHVPCKFFKVGGCTAGPSCPFSHAMAEPGQKEHCAWFIKGNCKFGHKCALAHILPGQDLSMDRKNKKAAQQAAAAANGGSGGGGGHGKERGGKAKRDQSAVGERSKNALLAGGSTAPTRVLNQQNSGVGRPPMSLPLKASISPSAPAPPLKDTDFSSFASLDEMEGVAAAESQDQADEDKTKNKKPSSGSSSSENATAANPSPGSPSPLPLSIPRATTTTSTPSAASRQADFGPIGSPPNARSSAATAALEQRSPGGVAGAAAPSRLNGNSATFSPGTSPRTPSHLNGINVTGASPGNVSYAAASNHNHNSNNNSNGNNNLLSSSPFSAPGTQTSFYPGSYGASLGHAGGVAASLGSAMMGGGRKGGWGDSYDVSSSPSGGGAYTGMLSSSHQHRSSGLSASVTRQEYDDGAYEYDEYGGRVGGRKMGTGFGGRVVVDEEMEDFIPGSLSDLLTPEERSRRMSRSNSGQPGFTAVANTLKSGSGGLGEGLDLTPGGGGGLGLGGLGGHRHSRSVPAPSLLGDLKSIWADTSAHPLPSSPGKNNASSHLHNHLNHPTHRGAPSTSSGLAARFEGLGLGVGGAGAGGGLGDEGNMSMSFGSQSSIGMMSPSNASAAFLPGFHQQYLAAKAKQAQAAQQAQLGLGGGGGGGLGRGLRNSSNPLYPTSNGTTNSIAGNYLGSGGGGAGLPSSVTNSTSTNTNNNSNSNSTVHTHMHGNTAHTYRTTPSPFDLTQNMIRPNRNGVLAANGNGNGTYAGDSLGGMGMSMGTAGLQGLSGGLGGLGSNALNSNNNGLGVGLGGGQGGVGGGLVVGAGAGGGGGMGEGATDLLLSVPHVLSPSTTRALQSHAPGQSLPQGLAAGLSRIHALPPLSNIVSPPSSGSASGGVSAGMGSPGLASNAGVGVYGEQWGTSGSVIMQQQMQVQREREMQRELQQQQQQQRGPQRDQQQMHQHHHKRDLQQQQRDREQQLQREQGPPGLPELPGGKLSYSAAAAAVARAGNNATPLVPPGVTRNVGNVGGRGVQQQVQHDDDELFSMDG